MLNIWKFGGACFSTRDRVYEVARKIIDPQILAEWSILWPARAQSAAIARFLDSARRCAVEKGWRPRPATTATAAGTSPARDPWGVSRGLDVP